MKSKLRISLIALGLALCLAGPALAWVPTRAEDAAVQGKGGMELFFCLESASDNVGDFTDLRTTFTYGLNETMDLWAHLPIVLDQSDPGDAGLSDLTVGMKWVFDKKEAWSLALEPYLTLPTGDEDKLLGYGKVNLGAILIASWARAPWAVNLNLDFYTNNYKGADNETGYTLAGETEYTLDKIWTLVGELSFEKYGDAEQNYLLAGACYNISEKLNLGLGLKMALNDEAVDSTLLVGATLSL